MSRSNDAAYRFHAARYLQRQVKQIAAHLDGIRLGEDIESVHYARVATRRIRAAMKMFGDCWQAGEVKRWRKPIRAITAALGEARDRDVQSQFLCGMLAKTPEPAHVPGIVRILAKVERKRERLQAKVLKAIERLERSKVLVEMPKAAKSMLAESGAEAAGPSDVARERTKPFIRRQLSELLFDEESLENPEDFRRHHAMRIGAKRLRYTLEIARPLFEGRLDDIIEAAKKVQSYLGDIHDCDVWVHDLDDFARKEYRRVEDQFGGSGRCARLQAGIEYLSAERVERRRQVFAELVEYWHCLKSQGLWDRLAQLAEPSAPPPATEQPSRSEAGAAAGHEEGRKHEAPAKQTAAKQDTAGPPGGALRRANGAGAAARELALFVAAD